MKKLGTAVVVNGEVVAWFRSFTEEAREWCAQEYFGQWYGFDSYLPELLSKKQQRKRAKSFARLQKKIQKRYPEDTTTVHTHHGYSPYVPNSEHTDET